jgi:NADH dehydrogenase/NADH:ubiquinone oxidoreductase subunit G
VRVTIDGRDLSVPKGTLIVDAAKKLGIDIPVFCYHPKMKPVGMCRMCLVEVGRPQRDRASGQVIRDAQGQPVMQFSGKLETACTTPVEDGWVIKVDSPLAREGREQVIEFLLTSHPLDCPVCDKGGECPLQNQTLTQGPGTSRSCTRQAAPGQEGPARRSSWTASAASVRRCVQRKSSTIRDRASPRRKLEITFSDPASTRLSETPGHLPVGR